MVDIELFGRINASETTDFINARKNAEALVKGFNAFNGILERDSFVTKIDQAITKIDALNTFKTTLNSIKTTLQAA